MKCLELLYVNQKLTVINFVGAVFVFFLPDSSKWRSLGNETKLDITFFLAVSCKYLELVLNFKHVFYELLINHSFD